MQSTFEDYVQFFCKIISELCMPFTQLFITLMVHDNEKDNSKINSNL